MDKIKVRIFVKTQGKTFIRHTELEHFERKMKMLFTINGTGVRTGKIKQVRWHDVDIDEKYDILVKIPEVSPNDLENDGKWKRHLGWK